MNYLVSTITNNSRLVFLIIAIGVLISLLTIIIHENNLMANKAENNMIEIAQHTNNCESLSRWFHYWDGFIMKPNRALDAYQQRMTELGC